MRSANSGDNFLGGVALTIFTFVAFILDGNLIGIVLSGVLLFIVCVLLLSRIERQRRGED